MKRTNNKVIVKPKKVSVSRIKKSNIRSSRPNRKTLIKHPTVIHKSKTNTSRLNQIKPNAIYRKVLPVFKGETIYIVGGGPSLQTFNWDLLKTKKVIAINKAFKYITTADVIYWTDSRLYNWYKNEIDSLACLKYTISQGAPYDDKVNLLKKGQRHGLEKDPSVLAHGDNSGYAAINLAYHLGASKIVLLGYDMGYNNNKTHFHDGYPIKPTRKEIYNTRFSISFPHIADPLKAEGVKVYNTSQRSPLNCFPKISIEQSLRL
jgi:hypothetical protein